MDGDDQVALMFYYNFLHNPPSSSGSRTKNTSALQGQDWVQEIINAPDNTFYDQVRVTRPCFYALVEFLTERGLISEGPRSRVGVVEQVMMFLRTVSMHHRMRDEEERLQHSTQTINYYFYKVKKALLSLAPKLIVKPDYTRIPQKILVDNRFYPYLEHCVGALDGTLIPAHVPVSKSGQYRSRKGTTTQNVLAIVDFDMLFRYVNAGWEGSARDARVLMDAVTRDQNFPKPSDGRYYLCDAGYANYDNFLTPYRGTRYNLPEFNNTGIQPRSPKELFNHRHSQLRNVVERTFGVLKSRFPILGHGMPCFRLGSQPEIVITCCVLHNWIRLSQFQDNIFEANHPHFEPDTLLHSVRRLPNPEAVEAQNQRRDDIANQMWADFAG